MNYKLHRIIAFVVGGLLSLLPTSILRRFTGGSDSFKRGLCIANNPGDEANAERFKPRMARVSYTPERMGAFSKWANEQAVDFYVQCGQESNTDAQNAREIVDCERELDGLKKPRFYSLVNEANDYSYLRVNKTINLVHIKLGYLPVIVKGAHTAIDESAAMKKYVEYASKPMPELSMYQPHVIHMYFKPFDGSLDSRINNLLKKFYLTFMLVRLNSMGIPACNIVIGETHDASKTRKGFPDHGDYVYSTKEGWEFIEKLCSKLGIDAACYYHAPFLGYEGNTVGQAKKL